MVIKQRDGTSQRPTTRRGSLAVNREAACIRDRELVGARRTVALLPLAIRGSPAAMRPSATVRALSPKGGTRLKQTSREQPKK